MSGNAAKIERLQEEVQYQEAMLGILIKTLHESGALSPDVLVQEMRKQAHRGLRNRASEPPRPCPWSKQVLEQLLRTADLYEKAPRTSGSVESKS